MTACLIKLPVKILAGWFERPTIVVEADSGENGNIRPEGHGDTCDDNVWGALQVATGECRH
ncbi:MULTISPECIES: hypothetical protein [unclassified Bradyrhizobium]|uniref:hypothetical protein n=1 Tax=unclassified Bradyrhizobium TaxID=2631580 RepID=UPI001BABE67C|nr:MULTISPECIES: hypothetical protein [unclassified Bradyrhizobium]MBR1203005.1 hypothetical protein [Bradyrhizobium sp. AUGA SZCCT0124]MBR1314420.1 hypothetical protein [Bradyrhizobium sp. AUGA SZCCT0051]MBR1342562.1 hypothetical protein [Bradyrhizobium sp. AUGA SZCCT0105]MBR1352792.1 hypothetical protein [Bradyrhizobium sp. AUGA SZCCT0045]